MRMRYFINYEMLKNFQVKGHLDYAKKLTQVLEAVGIRCTPTSMASQANLAEESQKEETEEKKINKEQTNKKQDTAKLEDTSSLVIERLKGLRTAKEEKGREIEERKANREKNEEEEEQEEVGLIEKKKLF